MRARTMTAAVVVLVLVAGCGSLGDGGSGGDGDGGDGGTDPGTGSGSTSLTIVLDETGAGDEVTFTLTCDPPGGDHPDPEGACAALEAAGGVDAFAPTPADRACTEIYGGPQTATVEGTVDGTDVSATFSRVNGCEIARWDALAPLLGSSGGA